MRAPPRWILAATLLALLLPALPAAAGPGPGGVYDLPEADFHDQVRLDVQTLQQHDAGLRRVLFDLRESGVLRVSTRDPLSEEQKQTLLTSWAALYDYIWSVEVIRQYYWDFLQLPPGQRDRHLWGYLLTHAALTMELAAGLTFADLIGGDRQLDRLLDEPHAELGVPARAFAALNKKVIHVSTTTQLLTGDAYAAVARPLLRQAGLQDRPEVVWLQQASERNSNLARDRLKRRGVALFLGNAADIFRDETARAIFPVQRGVAEWLGDTRVRRLGQPLISRAQAEAFRAGLEPGDILVARQNWYLSNIGLPGFWPHAELYLGSPGALAAWFDADAATTAFVRGEPEQVASFSALLQARYPRQWEAYQGLDRAGEPCVILEAISEGVSFSSLAHGMLVDYLGAMRPRLPRVEKAKAILRAFSFQGRPYDFDFDFYSDATLVCSELVYKAYAPGEGQQGLRLELVDVAGRRTLPPNVLVRQFDAEYDTPDRQLDFVGFLHGRERERDARAGDLAEFRASWRRPKWDVAQK